MLAGESLALHLVQKMLLTRTSCRATLWHAGIAAGLNVLVQIWTGPVLDGDVFKVSKNNTAEKAALSLLQQLRSNTQLLWG